MATNNKINVSDLDFDLIKTNLKEFLKGQDQFTDYDFEGSGLNVLLDVLAYNTHYNALYTNLAINEMFLDSASKRDSVVSIANNYGYLPVSRTAAKATISLAIPIGSNASSTLSLPKYSGFTSTVSGIDYSFYTNSENIGLRNQTAGNYVFDSIPLYEGSPVIERFNIFTNTKIQLQNQNIDVATIRVTVQDPQSLNSTTYNYSEKILTLTSTSKAFFVKEIENQLYEIYFGNNNLGAQPSIGSVVTVEYFVTNGSAANGIKLFTYNGSSLGGVPIITVLSAATGGREGETTDEIKYNVSHKYRVQDRAVTSSDYVDIIKTNYPDIDAINCWGGDTMTPPIYGKIYISIKPKTSLFLTTSEKNYIIEEIIKPKAMLGIFPQMVDPIYNSIELTTTVYYNPNLTNKSSSQIKQLVRQSILDYNDINLQKFDGVLRYSRLIGSIDITDNSIINNITTYKVRRNVDVIYNLSSSYTVKLNNPIYNSGVAEESVMTNGFYINSIDPVAHYIDDDANGNLRLFYYNPLDYTKVFVDKTIGTVNYITGELSISSLFVTGVVESDLQFIIKPQSDDIVSKENQIVNIDENMLTINVVQEVNSSSHQFASSRI
jgi:hypothetical protein